MATNAHGRVHALPVQPYFERIVADHEWRQEVANDARGGLGADWSFRLAPADTAGLRLQAYQHAVECGRVDIAPPRLRRVVHRERTTRWNCPILPPRGVAPIGGFQRRRLQDECFQAGYRFSFHATSRSRLWTSASRAGPWPQGKAPSGRCA